MLSLQTSYGKQEFWEDRYDNEKEQFDWLQRFSPNFGNGQWREIIMKYFGESVKQGQLADHCKDQYKILIVGCGISRTAEELWDEGFHDITSVDFSYSAVKFMQDTYRGELNKLVFKQMDVRNMQFPDNTFDMVIDKACLDAVICSDGSKMNVSTMVSEIYRVTKKNGYYIVLSHGKENQRMKYLTTEDFQIKKENNTDHHAHKIQKDQIGQTSTKGRGYDAEKAKYHFCYICHKSSEVEPEAQSPPKQSIKQVEKKGKEIARQASLSAGRANSVKSNNSARSYTPKQNKNEKE